jgi:hypothetical protein
LGDVATGSAVSIGRKSESIVFDIEDIGSRCVVAMLSAAQNPLVAVEASPPCACDSPIALVAQRLAVIADGLRPAHRRRVLEANSTTSRQHAGPSVRTVGNYAYVSTVTETAATHHRGAKRWSGTTKRQQ